MKKSRDERADLYWYARDLRRDVYKLQEARRPSITSHDAVVDYALSRVSTRLINVESILRRDVYIPVRDAWLMRALLDRLWATLLRGELGL